jgi:pyruvate/2-oxoglutarate dehydrogenase complex dihydrolipoamide dehydrogenase (E3) component
VPKKILVAAADGVQGARDLMGKGVSAGSLALDWPELMRFKRADRGDQML